MMISRGSASECSSSSKIRASGSAKLVSASSNQSHGCLDWPLPSSRPTQTQGPFYLNDNMPRLTRRRALLAGSPLTELAHYLLAWHGRPPSRLPSRSASRADGGHAGVRTWSIGRGQAGSHGTGFAPWVFLRRGSRGRAHVVEGQAATSPLHKTGAVATTAARKNPRVGPLFLLLTARSFRIAVRGLTLAAAGRLHLDDDAAGRVAHHELDRRA